MTHCHPVLLALADGEDKSSPLKNRIRKNYRHFKKWAKRSQTDCFRVYDRDIKEYPLAIDYYAGRFCVQFFSYRREEEEASPALMAEVNSTLTDLFKVGPQNIHWRSRIRRRKMEQYERTGQSNDFFTVVEYGILFRINLRDYLDTGLFLDHRETRRLVAGQAEGKSVLNLFAYTCSFSVHAAAAGAQATKSIDLSKTYTHWGAENFALNSLDRQNHEIVQADCMQWLEEEVDSPSRYDIIIIDPPTLSRSKRMEEIFDVQQDYPYLIECGLNLLKPNGVLFFSTNSRKFRLNPLLLPPCTVDDISSLTVPPDFQRKGIHQCWKIQTSAS